MDTRDIKEKADDLLNHAGDYADSFIKLNVLRAAKKVTNLGAGLVSAVSAMVMGMLVLIFGGFALGWWLGDITENRALGFLLVAVFYLLLLGLIAAFRRKLIFPYVRNMLIRKIYEQENQDIQ